MMTTIDDRPGDYIHTGPVLLSILKKRADFLRAARGKRHHTTAFVLQAWCRGDDAEARVGFTCSKKVGNAVARNRAKRRLRASVSQVMPNYACNGWDYVLIGRAGVTADIEFTKLCADLRGSLKKVHV